MEKKSLDYIMDNLPERMVKALQKARGAFEDRVTEIVLRTERPLCIYESNRLFFITENGYLSDSVLTGDMITVGASEMKDTVLRLCDYSVYAYQHEINSGYITIGGGVRVGLCGQAVMSDGRVSNVRNISSLCFRIARDVKGCADSLLSKIDPLKGVLICGAPGSGKTTMIRDVARQLSYRCRVSVADERCELSACSRGEMGFGLGLCDIFAGYPKGIAAHQAIRSMAPQVIVCDELGDQSDVEMLSYSLRCGVSFIATVHASSMHDLRNRVITKDLINTGAFRYIVFMNADAPGRIDRIYEMCDSHG
ncbi:MAG: stage III sporulation protein AA [Ruminococcus sp.]|uniref:stage III sporulation protein AA n=1 Tax=Ruminococcus sp. TaxID=41978 RepID=UPI0028734BA8|nr:stage III sporulation protein AA [Ruminococcus sp.]MBQ3284015.1 stage III sporulation protein AA [Ruminococcus sp.]